jgi:hypothetical protein
MPPLVTPLREGTPVLLLVLCLLLGAGRSADAQQTEAPDPVADAPVHFGIFGLSPRLAITDLGVDSNVFNSTDNPRQDFTFTATPSLKVLMRTGPGLLAVEGRVDFVYFAKYATERSANRASLIRYEYPFMRVTPFVSYSTTNTNERPGYEIDTRARRFEGDLEVGAIVPVGSITNLELSRRQLRVSFDDDATYQGESLQQTLDRKLDTWDMRWRQAFTVLTTWVVHASFEQERFEYESYRDSNSVRLESGFILNLDALVRGTAMFGYRRLTGAEAGTLADFSGLTADVDVAYTAPTQSRLQLALNRDLHYSFEIEQPYYVQTGWNLTGTQRVIGQWDVQMTAGRDWLDYRALDPTDTRRDRISRLGGGIGYDAGENLRIGIDLLWQTRRSELSARDYRSFTSGVSLTYGY